MSDLCNILDDERLALDHQLIDVVLPAPLCRLVKDDVPGDDDSLADWVVAAIHHGADLVVDEDGLDVAVVELLSFSHVLLTCVMESKVRK
jgi:hypothetical protein